MFKMNRSARGDGAAMFSDLVRTGMRRWKVRTYVVAYAQRWRERRKTQEEDGQKNECGSHYG